jgi:hypothetical protein
MKRFFAISRLITVVSLLLSAIWLVPTLAIAAPAFAPLGELRAAGMQVPAAMDLDSSGNLFVADARGGLVHKFDTYGRLQASFELQGSGRGIAVSADGSRLYVARKDAVVIADAASGAALGLFDGAEDGAEFGVAGEIDVDAAGNVFVADGATMEIKVYDAAGQYLSRFGGVGSVAGSFSQIGGLSFNPAGQLVVADSSARNNLVQVFTLGTDLTVVNVASYSSLSTANFGSPAMQTPRGLAFDDQGRGYFLAFMATELRATSAAFGYLGKYAVGAGGVVIDAIYDDVSDRLFVSCDSGAIEIIGVDGGSTPVYANHAPTAATPRSPIGGSEVASATPTLVINNASDADGDSLTYSVAVRRDDTVVFQTSVAAAAGETTSLTVDQALAENAAFSWTVQASDGEASSAVSAAAGFVVNAVKDAPSVPVLSAPLNGVATAGQDALSWDAATDPDPNATLSYTVEIAADADFSRLVASKSLAETALTLDSFAAYGDLVPAASYFWRVSAIDDSALASAPSAVGSFKYETTTLSVRANVPGAVVSLGGNLAYAGQLIGEAPLELRDLEAGVVSVVVERPGFESYVEQVELAAGTAANVYAELTPAMQVEKLSPQKHAINGRAGLAVAGSAAPFIVDFDSDGDLDLLVGDAAGRVTLFANLRQGGRHAERLQFDEGVALALPVLPGAVPFVADWNNDGRKDLLVGLADGTVRLFHNSGTEQAPEFGAGSDLQTVGGVLSVAAQAAPCVTDYNDDGVKDLLVGNAAGQLQLFLNQGSDAAPLLVAETTIKSFAGAVVPLSIDWNADGSADLVATSNGYSEVYSLVGGAYRKIARFGDRRLANFAVFPVVVNDNGKQLIAGQADGSLELLGGKSEEPVAAFHLAMQDKAAELMERVALEAAGLLDDASAINALVAVAEYEQAADALQALMAALPQGEALTSAAQLSQLCQ